MLNFGQPVFQLDKGPLGKLRRIVITENRMEVPVFQRRSLESLVRIPDGGWAQVGGIMKTDRQSVEDKVPVLGDLPLIGQAARTQFTLDVDRYLYFFVRGQLIDPAGTPVAPQSAE